MSDVKLPGASTGHPDHPDHGLAPVVAVANDPLPPLMRRLLAEAVGTALLVTVVVGSGIMATTLSPDDVGLQLLYNSLATLLGLTVLILQFGPVSGAHFNPVVSFIDWLLGHRSGHGLPLRDVAAYAVAQTSGRSPARSWPTSCTRWRLCRSRPTTGSPVVSCCPRWSPPPG